MILTAAKRGEDKEHVNRWCQVPQFTEASTSFTVWINSMRTRYYVEALITVAFTLALQIYGISLTQEMLFTEEEPLYKYWEAYMNLKTESDPAEISRLTLVKE